MDADAREAVVAVEGRVGDVLGGGRVDDHLEDPEHGQVFPGPIWVPTAVLGENPELTPGCATGRRACWWPVVGE